MADVGLGKPLNVYRFFNFKDMRPVFRALRSMDVTTYLWTVGERPDRCPKPLRIEAGSELVVCEYSNFGDGHSMFLLSALDAEDDIRWFRFPYDAMSYVEHREILD